MQCKKVQLGSGEPSETTQVGFRKCVQVLAGNTDMYDNGRKATYNEQGFVAGTLELCKESGASLAIASSFFVKTAL